MLYLFNHLKIYQMSTPKIVSTETKKVNEVSKVNLSKFAKQLESKQVKEKSTKDTIYIYPEKMTEAEKSNEVGKKWRNSVRNKIRRFSNQIFVYAKTNNLDALKKEVKDFKTFYKETYRINDFSLGSISQSKNEEKANDIKLMLEIIKEVN